MKSEPFLSETPIQRNTKSPKGCSLLHPYSSLLKPNHYLNQKDLYLNADWKRLKSKNSKIKSLFKDAKMIKGQTFLNEIKAIEKSTHRCASSQRDFSATNRKLQMTVKKMKIGPTVEVCINNQQGDLSKIIDEFKEFKEFQEYLAKRQPQLQPIKEIKLTKQNQSIDSFHNFF